MTTKAAAFHTWASSFGIPAYSSASVPEDASLPYITYDFGAASFGEQFACTLNVWTDGSDADANAKATAICDSLPAYARCDGGALRLEAGSPAWQAVLDESDVKRRYINVDVENLTNTL